ncbi:hypothetical protein [Auritidibacter sp. NML100628]|uniref:hypothetical protein n=1 Tax=Auritidibacter sp. NML100628 TaxID=2170742 RepID=UPI0011B298AA|nr:hypothetical protein [Auritidibacter sp. NML100628]
MSDFSWNGRAINSAIEDASARGLNNAAEHLRATSVPLTPLDTSRLRGSLVVNEATPNGLVASVSTNLPYAVRQHEELGYHHRDGQAKYLETGANMTRTVMGQIIRDATKKAR